MSLNIENLRTPHDFLHGDEHLCFGDCIGDKDIYCTCAEEKESNLNRMAEEFHEWLIEQGQAS